MERLQDSAFSVESDFRCDSSATRKAVLLSNTNIPYGVDRGGDEE
jgi:hypothetical protein